MVVVLGGVGLFYDKAGGCLSRYMGILGHIIDTNHSPHTFKSPTAILASQFEALKPMG